MESVSSHREIDGFVLAGANGFDLPPRAAFSVGSACTVGLDEDVGPFVEELRCVVSVVCVVVVLVVEYVVADVVGLFVVAPCSPLGGVGGRGEVGAFHGVQSVGAV